MAATKKPTKVGARKNSGGKEQSKVGESIDAPLACSNQSGKRATKPKVEPVKSPSKNEWGLTWQQESFAQLIASGRSQADAYRAAYPGSQEWKVDSLYAEASNLAADPRVSIRIKTLRAIITQQVIDAAVADKTWVLKRLKTVAERCMQAAPVLTKKGEPVMIETEAGEIVPAFEFNSAGANRALELLGKEEGMFVERHESGKPGDFGTKDEVRARIRERQVKLGLTKIVPGKAATH